MGFRTYWADLKASFGYAFGPLPGIDPEEAFDPGQRSLGGSLVAAPGGGMAGAFGSYDQEREQQPDPGVVLASSSAVYIATRYRSQKLASVPLRFYTVDKAGKRKAVTSGPLIELFTKVNPFWTARRLFEMTELSLCLYGDSFWFLDRGAGSKGAPQEIWWAHPDKVKVVRSADDYISHFEFDPGSGKPLQFARDETAWYRYPNPTDELDGLSPLRAAMLSAQIGTAAMRSNAKMFTQGMQLAGFVSPPEGQTWTSEQGKEIEVALTRRFTGANKAHRWAALAAAMKFNSLTISPKDAEYLGAIDASFDDVCRVFGLSPDLLGGERTYANAAEARLAFWQDTMIPETSFIADEITEQILPLFPNTADLAAFDLSGIDVLQELEESKWTRWEAQIKIGAKTVNQWREVQGDKPVAWGDAWWTQATMVPVTSDNILVVPASSITIEDPQQEQKAIEELARVLKVPTQTRSLAGGRRMRMAYGSDEHIARMRMVERRATGHQTLVGNATADLMRRQKKSILAKLRARGVRDVAEIVDAPFDMPRWVKQFRQTIRPVITSVIEDVGQQAADELSIGMSFDIKDPNVIRAVESQSQRFSKEVNQTTYDQLKASIAEGVDAGESIDDIAARVESVMGDRIRSSAETIARTEVNAASTSGTHESWRQSGVVAGKSWLAALDDRTRETHVEAHGQTRALDDDFTVGDATGPGPGLMGDPAEDINCRCSEVAVLDIDWEGPTG